MRDAVLYRAVSLLVAIGCIAFLPYIGGCSATGVLLDRDSAAVKAGRESIVLLRVECVIDDLGCEAFPSMNPFDAQIWFNVGGFESAGAPKRDSLDTAFLSDASRQAGWTYFVLAPGVHYLSAQANRNRSDEALRNAPRWKVDIPQGSKVLYAGTLHVTGRGERLLFGGTAMDAIRGDEATVRDEHELADKLASELLPDFGPVTVALMQRWHPGEPIILRSPPSTPPK
jgi:hypothetical protein